MKDSGSTRITEWTTDQPGKVDRPAVLVVDDDDGFREAIRAWLEAAGYAAIAVASYGPALVVLESGARIDLLITDIVMPGRLDGIALARMAKLRRPALRIIYVTGHDLGTAASADTTDSQADAAPVLCKPIKQADLLAEVERRIAA